MSGVNRAILAEIAADGKSSEQEIKQAYSPDAIRAETGRAQGAKGADDDSYIGKQAKPAKP